MGVVTPEQGAESEVKESNNFGSSPDSETLIEEEAAEKSNMGKGNLNVQVTRKTEGVDDLSRRIDNLAVDSHGEEMRQILQKLKTCNLESESNNLSRRVKIPVEDEEDCENEEEHFQLTRKISVTRTLETLDGEDVYLIPKAPIGGIPVTFNPGNNALDHDGEIRDIVNRIDPPGKFRKPTRPLEAPDFSYAPPVSNSYNFLGGQGGRDYLRRSEQNGTHQLGTFSDIVSMRALNGGTMTSNPVRTDPRDNFGSESSDCSVPAVNQCDSSDIDQLLQSLSSPGSAYSPSGSDYTDVTSPASGSSVFGPQSPPYLYPDDDSLLSEVNHAEMNPKNLSDIENVLGADKLAEIIGEVPPYQEPTPIDLPTELDSFDFQDLWKRFGPEETEMVLDILRKDATQTQKSKFSMGASVEPNFMYQTMPLGQDPFLERSTLTDASANNLPQHQQTQQQQNNLNALTNDLTHISGAPFNVYLPVSHPQAQITNNNPKWDAPLGNPHPSQIQNTRSCPPRNTHNPHRQFPQQNPHPPRQVNSQNVQFTQTNPVQPVTNTNQSFSVQPTNQLINQPIDQQNSIPYIPLTSSTSPKQPQMSAPVGASTVYGNTPIYHPPQYVPPANFQGLPNVTVPGITTITGPVVTTGSNKIPQPNAPMFVIVTASPAGSTSTSQPISLKAMNAPTVTLPISIILPSPVSTAVAKTTGVTMTRLILPKVPGKMEAVRPAPPAELVPLEEDKAPQIVLDKRKAIQALRWIEGFKDAEMIYCPDEDGDTLLHNCALKGEFYSAYAVLNRVKQDKTPEEFLNYINQGNIKGQTALYQATVVNCWEIVLLLIKQGADPNCSSMRRQPSGDIQFLTALHVAAKKGEDALPTLKSLLTSPKLCKDEVNSDGHTALYCAAKEHGKLNNNKQIINSTKTSQVLLRNGAEISKQDGKTGQTTLHAIVESRDMVLLRIIMGMLPTKVLTHVLQQQSYQGNTCLHIAAQLPSKTHEDQVIQKQILEILLDYGSDTSIRNAQQKTAKDLLRCNCSSEFSDTKLLDRMKPSSKKK